MNPVLTQLITIGIGAISAFISASISIRLNRRDKETHEYRQKQRQIKLEQEQQKHTFKQATLGLMRIALLQNYRHAKRQGYYTLDEREVYHPLYLAYKDLGGDGIIDRIRDEIVDLPTTAPQKK